MREIAQIELKQALSQLDTELTEQSNLPITRLLALSGILLFINQFQYLFRQKIIYYKLDMRAFGKSVGYGCAGVKGIRECRQKFELTGCLIVR